MMQDLYMRSIALHDMMVAALKMAHVNLCAEREEKLGGWQRDHTEAFFEHDEEYAVAKARLEELLKVEGGV